MCDLTGSMNAGIGSTGAADLGLAEQLAGNAHQPSLNRFRRVTLRLPTGISSALVLDGQFVSRHLLNDELGTMNDEPRTPCSSFIVHRSSLMRPKNWQVLGNELVVIWDDGHESYYP